MWRTEVEWVLPGAALDQIRDLADARFWPDGVKRGQLVAVVTHGDQLKAQIAYPRSNRSSPTLRARLVPDDRGVLVQGHTPREEAIRVTFWLVFWAGMALAVLVAAHSAVELLVGLAFTGGFGSLAPNIWGHVSRQQERAIDELQKALSARFAVDD